LLSDDPEYDCVLGTVLLTFLNAVTYRSNR
jgi:hypothetical protein